MIKPAAFVYLKPSLSLFAHSMSKIKLFCAEYFNLKDKIFARIPFSASITIIFLQAGNASFNRGSIMNAGFMEVFTQTDAQCFVFHDVDQLPEDDRNMYSCPSVPRHLSVGFNVFQVPPIM